MTSSLTHQPTGPQRPFLNTPFFPLDLNHSTLYNLYAGNANCINQLVQSANLFGIKDLNDTEPGLHSAFSIPTTLPVAEAETGNRSKIDANSLLFSTIKTTPPTTGNEFLGACDFVSQQSGSSSRLDSSMHDLSTHAIGSCDSDGSISSSHSVTNEAANHGVIHGSQSNEKKRKELVRDDAYWIRRQKNNDAAKRSRDSRRRREDEVAVRAALLEQENLRLRFEVERLRTEIERHRIVAINSKLVGHNPFVSAAI
ncbi:Protein giant [Aphelenchoides besseyi]|nr:Protein giant [Aphelenchoides besseyi]KAI6199927.1 Protein giant [Aphelenchoides besseyi]